MRTLIILLLSVFMQIPFVQAQEKQLPERERIMMTKDSIPIIYSLIGYNDSIQYMMPRGTTEYPSERGLINLGTLACGTTTSGITIDYPSIETIEKFTITQAAYVEVTYYLGNDVPIEEIQHISMKNIATNQVYNANLEIVSYDGYMTVAKRRFNLPSAGNYALTTWVVSSYFILCSKTIQIICLSEIYEDWGEIECGATWSNLIEPIDVLVDHVINFDLISLSKFKLSYFLENGFTGSFSFVYLKNRETEEIINVDSETHTDPNGEDEAVLNYILPPGQYSILLQYKQGIYIHYGLLVTCNYQNTIPTGVSSARNHIVSFTPTTEVNFIDFKNGIILTEQEQNSTSPLNVSIEYFDGLGRPDQTVAVGSSPDGLDIVTPFSYDPFGREAVKNLPYEATTENGSYKPNAQTAQRSWYNSPPSGSGIPSDARPFSETFFEPSPLNRVVEQYGPGTAWHGAGKSVKTGWLTNTSSGELSCALYAVASAGSIQRKGLYSAGELYVTKSTGEDGHVSYTFTDKIGQTVLKRVMDGQVMNDTYYVFDDSGNLCYVLPPAAADVLSATATWNDDNITLKEYAFVYKYDARNRCILKRLPGRGPVVMKYDRADRLIFSQDGNQQDPSKNEWTFYLYDAFGRPVVTGTCPSQTFTSFEGTVVNATYNGGIILGGYTVTPSLTGIIKLMTVNYYDDYRFRKIQVALADTTKLRCGTLYGYGDAYPNNTSPNGKGMLTGTRNYRLDDPSKYTVSALYHDHRGRVVQTHASNLLGGFDDEYFAYTFTGKVKQRRQVHSAPGKTTQTEVQTYTYDHAERLLSVSHKLNSAADVTLSQYSYDEVGRVKTKRLATETSTYSYNTRGWLTRLTGTKFNQTLTYNAAVNGVTPSKALYSGNVSAMKWRAGDETVERGYQFSYDNMDRLTDAAYGEGASITANLNRFNETVSAYDKMGNMLALQRQGRLDSGYGVMDDLTYTYSGNQLVKVADVAAPSVTYENAFHFVDGADMPVEYGYDANGNLIKDLNRKITSITYNSLNLPQGITLTGDRSVTYGYDAAGRKLDVAYRSGGTTVKTEYAGNKIYKNGTLSMILTEEGYITLSGTTPTYHYFLKDHQGNNRVVLSQTGAVEQVNHYYPFGGLFGEGVQTSKQPYKFNGKELDREMGLNLYDYGARHYDAALGRWFTVDPLSEKYYSFSPYVYCVNNPIMYIDPDGREVYYAQDGTHLGKIGDNDDIRVINATLSNKDALSHISSGSEDAISALMGNSVAFADYFTSVSDVTNGAKVVPYSGNCYDAAAEQMNNAGYAPEGSRAQSTIFTKVGAGTDNPNNLTENAVGGAIKIMTDLKAGKPVMIGVEQTNAAGNYNRQDGNNNPLTSHFVVVNSSTASGGVVSFNYLDNAGGRGPLNLNTSNGAISGGITNRGAVKNYTVSEVRNSWRIRR